MSDDRKRMVLTTEASEVFDEVAEQTQTTLMKTGEMAAICLADRFGIDIDEPKHWAHLRVILSATPAT